MTIDDNGTLLGKVIADVIGVAVRDILQELRPDVLFADEMPEFFSELKGLEPSSIKNTIRSIIKDN